MARTIAYGKRFLREVDPMMRTAVLLFFVALCNSPVGAQVLDRQKVLDAQTFWSNRDFDWYKANIPFFECPDEEINTTYYYRWELVTRHICYGSPKSGYSFTEFANRPSWSGAYGSISCPSGHQFYEIRWLNEPRYARDYLRYWFRTPGAQPRNYSSWLADSAWAVHQVHPNKAFIVDLLPDLVRNDESWKKRHWIASKKMFWQSGHDDGMEFNINSRQTKNILRGDHAFRPTFNTYMWADANALARIAELAGDTKKAEQYRKAAAELKKQIQTHLWDPKRQFFFPMSSRDEEDKEGNVVKANTLTYQSGKYVGNTHGRELHGYVPWAFNLPDAGHEDAWKFLMDRDYFYAPFGPTTTERNDPMFLLQKGCCWWSGQSWPFATTQTLKAMANLLHNYQQTHISRADYLKLLHIFAISHRKDGKPYIAEALHPETGSWEGHDMHNRSEHYFHSNFNDLVVTGLVGLKTSDGDQLTIDPLAPKTWDYFALESVPYRGHQLCVFWDATGKRYGRGVGLHVLVDGKKLASSPTLEKMTMTLPAAIEVPMPTEVRFNYAVNNEGNYFPRFSASAIGEHSSLNMICDGEARYDVRPVNRWTSLGSKNKSDWVQVDLGTARLIDTVKLYFLDDTTGIVPPKSFDLQYHNGKSWATVPGQTRSPKQPAGRRPSTIKFVKQNLQRLRVMMHHGAKGVSGLTELEVWGPGQQPYQPAPPPPGNLAANATGKGFPKAKASHHDIYGGIPSKAIDGRIIYRATPANRWTSYGSPNKTDWFEVDFGQPKSFRRVELHIYDDRGGVQPPASYAVQYLEKDRWTDVPGASHSPKKPKGSAQNSVTFDGVTSNKVRVVFTHAGRPRSGLTEFEVWEK
jgi:hypothetical protein